MAVRSKRLSGPTRLPNSVYTTIYTCPADETTLVKRILCGSEGSTTNVFLRLNGNSGAGTGLFSFAVAAPHGRDVETWFVLQPGDTVRAYASTGDIDISLHGAQLEGVAD